jgi:hypothetical protein
MMRRWCVFLTLIWICPVRSQDRDIPLIRRDLSKIEQAYRIIEDNGTGLWPGWSGYREIPFLLKYPGGTRILIGHPNPPEGFCVLAGVTSGERAVTIQGTGRTEIEKASGFAYLGAVSMLGEWQGRPVSIIEFDLKPFETLSKYEKDTYASTDFQILVCIHELFHQYLGSKYRFLHGSPITDPLIDGLVFSEIEGKALLYALESPEKERAKSYLEDFLTARNLRKRFVSEEQLLGESDQEVNEGLAEYTMHKVLDHLDESTPYIIDETLDPAFHRFRNKDLFLQHFRKRLLQESQNMFETTRKCYYYGGAQAFLLDRFDDGWRRDVVDSNRTLDRIIRDRVFSGKDFSKNKASDLNHRYSIRGIRRQYLAAFQKRARAFRDFAGQKGTDVIVNFRNVQPFLDVTTEKKHYRYDRFIVYPSGIDSIRLGKVLFRSKGRPLLKAMFSYIKSIEPDPSHFSLLFTSQEKESMHRGVDIETGAFTLHAPRVKIFQNEKMVKITVFDD